MYCRVTRHVLRVSCPIAQRTLTRTCLIAVRSRSVINAALAVAHGSAARDRVLTRRRECLTVWVDAARGRTPRMLTREPSRRFSCASVHTRAVVCTAKRAFKPLTSPSWNYSRPPQHRSNSGARHTEVACRAIRSVGPHRSRDAPPSSVIERRRASSRQSTTTL